MDQWWKKLAGAWANSWALTYGFCGPLGGVLLAGCWVLEQPQLEAPGACDVLPRHVPQHRQSPTALGEGQRTRQRSLLGTRWPRSVHRQVFSLSWGEATGHGGTGSRKSRIHCWWSLYERGAIHFLIPGQKSLPPQELEDIVNFLKSSIFLTDLPKHIHTHDTHTHLISHRNLPTIFFSHTKSLMLLFP